MIDKILDAGIRAPSGQNTQPWAFLVIEDEEGKISLERDILAGLKKDLENA